MTGESWFHTKTFRLAVIMITTMAAVTSLVVFFVNKNQQSLHPLASPTITGEKELGVAAIGRLEPAGEVINLSVPPNREGAKVEQLLVKVGDQVTIDTTIAILDNRDRLLADLEHQQTLVKIAEANLNKIKAGAKLGEIEAQKANISRIEAEISGQTATFSSNIAKIKAELANATRECSRYENLYQNGAISASEQDNLCVNQSMLTEELAATKANRQRILTSLEAEYAQAKATLTAISEVRDVDVAIATAELAEAKASVKQAQANLDLAYLKAPQDGQILEIYTYPGEVVTEKGIVAIGDTQQMYAVAEIYETDISRVTLGQSATITSIGYVGRLQGTVAEIGLQIAKQDVLNTDPAAAVDSRVVEVKIKLDRASSEKVSNLTNLQVNIVIHPDSDQ